MHIDWYRGWVIWQSQLKGWIATQHGVEVCARSREALLGVIDRHIEDRNDWINRRGIYSDRL